MNSFARVVCLLSVQTLLSISALAGPSRDINTYTLFAYDELRFNGETGGTGTFGVIVGSVGVNRVDPTPNDANYLLNMGGGGGSHDVTMSDGSEIVADSARLDEDTSAYDLYVNILVGGSAPTVRHSGPSNFTFATASEAIIAATNLPTLPSFSAGSSNITVSQNATNSLTPGSYGEIRLNDGSTLIVTGGTYTVSLISMGRNTSLKTGSGTVFRIAKYLIANNNSFIGPSDDAQFKLRSDGQGGSDNTASYGQNSESHGQFFAPNGTIAMGTDNTFGGHYWAKKIVAGWDVNVTGSGGGNVNHAPVADNQSVTNQEDTAKVIFMSGFDADSDPMTFFIVNNPTNGTLGSVSSNAVTYTPGSNFNGTDSFKFAITDGSLTSAPATVTIFVTAVNDAPVANGQSITATEDTATNVSLAATDVDSTNLTFSVTVNPSNGTLTGTAPNLSYHPATNFNGNDSFRFVASDGSATSSSALVSITVSAVNDPPVANGQSISTPEDTATNITLIATDVDSTNFTYSVSINPTNGTLSGSAPSLTYTPNTNFNGNDSFAFKVSDGSLTSAQAVVQVTVTPVNDAPVASSQSVTTPEDMSTNITLAATDIDSTNLTFTVVNQPTNGVLSGTAPNLSYAPNSNFFGNDSFTFRASDGSSTSGLAIVSISVSAVNDAPVASDQSVTTSEDTPTNITLTATDVDSTNLTFSVLSGPTNGTLSGAAPNLTYIPATDFNGNDAFTFKVSDGMATSSTATVAITVTAADDAPVADSQAVTTPEDTATNITLTASDVDSTNLIFTVVAQPTNGVLSGSAPNVIYTPAANFFGGDSFSFEVTDGSSTSTASIAITVTAVNDSPVADGQTVTTPEDTATNIILTASDVDDTNLAFAVVDGPTNGTLIGTAPNLTYAPAENFNGTDSFTFEVSDGTATSSLATVSLVITAVNDAPVADSQSVTTPEDTATNITLTGSDVDFDALTFAVVDSPTSGYLSGSAPNLTYHPNANFFGDDSFTFEISDGTATSALTTVSITISPVNDIPVADDQSVTTPEDTTTNITLTANDVETTNLAFTVLVGPTNGTLSGTPPNLTYSPAANINGNDSFTFEASDGAATSAVAIISITVTAVNDSPVADDQSISTPEDSATNITLTASDVESTNLTFNLLSSPTNGVLTGVAPNLAYVPNSNFFGGDSFSFEVSDGEATSNVATISIDVSSVNDEPVTSGQSLTTAEDTPTNITLTASDVDDTNLTFTVLSGPTYGALSGAMPNLTYTPATNFYGSDSFTFEVTDGSATTAPATVSIAVTSVNDAPVAFDQSVADDEDTATNITLTAFDAETNSLTFDLVTSPSNGVLGGFGSALTYTPNSNYFGPDSFQFVVSDDSLTSGPATVSITVLSVNDAPAANAGADQLIDFPITNSVLLSGTSSDDGTPNPLTNQWSKISGPGTVTFGYSTSLISTATFSAPGSYVLRLTVSDGDLSASDDVTIAVNGSPAINAGPDLIVTFPNGTNLVGSATDDGLPATNSLAVGWAQVAGPGYVLISNANSTTARAKFSQIGEYTIRFSASDTHLVASDDLNVSVRPGGTNAPPQVNAGQDQTVSGVSNVTLAGTVSDDNLPYPAQLTQTWSKVSGPGAVTFTNTGTAMTEASFASNGVYVLRLKASDGLLTNSDDVAINISFANLAPSVSAGPDFIIVSPTGYLEGAVSDDGIPTNAVVTVLWSLISGPPSGTVTFANASSLVTRISMSVTGVYSLRLTASDGILSAADTVVVSRLINQGPIVNAGPDSGIQPVACPITLNGTVTDDGRPSTQALTHIWHQLSGPGTATFDDPARLDTQARFSEPGIYVLELQASDSLLTASDTVEIRIDSPCVAAAPPGMIAWWKGDHTATDSAGTNHGVLVGATTYTDQPLGQAFSFDGINSSVRIPSNIVFDNIRTAFTVEAWIKPTSMSVTQTVMAFHNGGTNVGMNLEIAPDDDQGLLLRANVRGRSGNIAFDEIAQTPTSSIPVGVYTHVAFSYSRSGSVVMLYVNGQPTRVQLDAVDARTDWPLYLGAANTSKYFKGEMDEVSIYNRILAPGEVVGIYAAGRGGRCVPGSNQTPVVDAGADFTTSTGIVQTLQGRVTDDGRPVGGGVVSTWSVLAGPGTVTFGNIAIPQTTAVFDQPGIYVLQLTANDGERQASDSVVIRVDQQCLLQAITELAAWWPADGSTKDVISGTNAVLESATTYTQAMIGAGFHMATVGDGVFVPFYTNLNVGTYSGQTYEAWVKIDRLDIDQPVLEFFGAPNKGLSVSVKADGSLLANLRNDNAGQNDDFVQSSPGLVTTGVFHHIAVTVQRVITPQNTTTKVRLYLDGILVTEANPTIFGNLRTAYDLYLGYSPIFASSLEGTLDDVAIYRRALTSQEIYADYAAGSAGRCPISGNESPTVYAGPDFGIAGTSVTASLNGFAHDDGLPAGSSLSVQWSVLGGPATVTIASPTSSVTTATFAAPGVYLLELLATDGNSAPARDRIEVRVGGDCSASGNTSRVAWWPGNGDATDRMGNSPGDLLGVSGFGTGYVNLAFIMNGLNDGVKIPATPALNVGTNATGFTMAIWAKPDARRSSILMDQSPDTGGQQSFSLEAAGTNGAMHAVVYGLGPGAGNYVLTLDTTNGIMSTGVWQHFAFVYDRTNAVMKLYKDGSLIKTQSAVNVAAYTSQEMHMGYRPSTSAYFKGMLDEGTLYSRALNASEILSIYQAGTLGACPVQASNQAPVVHAGVVQTVVTGQTVSLVGFATDDGLPSGILTSSWSVASGTGTVTFGNASSLATTASFSTTGVFVLRLVAYDSSLSATDTVTVTAIRVPTNNPPFAYAGADILLSLGTPASLSGAASDDGLPTGSVLAVQWSTVSGPGAVTFANATSLFTSASITNAGSYVLRLQVTDSALSSSDDLTVNVKPFIANQAPYVNAGPDKYVGLAVTPTNPVVTTYPPPVVVPDRWLYDLALPGLTNITQPQAMYANEMGSENGRVYVGGTFRFGNGVLLNGLGQWDGCEWAPLYDPLLATNYWAEAGFIARPLDYKVDAYQGKVYVTGGFMRNPVDPNPLGNGVAFNIWDGVHWTNWPGPRLTYGFIGINDIKATSNGVFVCGGDFSVIPNIVTNGYTNSHKIARYSGTNWYGLAGGIVDTSTPPNSALPAGTVYSVDVAPNGDVYAGGIFNMICSNGIARNIARFNGTNWLALGAGITWSATYNPLVSAIAVASNGDVYVGGSFDRAGTNDAADIARWNGTNWFPLGVGVPGGNVMGLTFWHGDLYVAGNGPTVGNTNRYVASWDGAQWHALMRGSNNGLNAQVMSIAAADDGVYLGGDFLLAGGKAAGHIAKWGQPHRAALRAPDSVYVYGAPTVGTNITFAVEVSHPCGAGVFSLTFNADGGPVEYSTVATNAGSGALSVSFTNLYIPGTHYVTVTVTDGSGIPVSAIVPVIVQSPADLTLDGIVTDDGLPSALLTSQWTLVSGPAPVVLSCETCPGSAASFDTAGTYVFRLTGGDGALQSYDQVTVVVQSIGATNTAPGVDAGPDQLVTLSDIATLNGSISDDGLPAGSPVTGYWSLVTGPGTVTFANSNAAATTATFAAPGAYVLRLTGSDGALSSSDDVAITVSVIANTPPVVDAGPDTATMLPIKAVLNPTVTDDGQLYGVLSKIWSKVSGPGNVLFSINNSTNYATFNVPGTYVLRLTAFDAQYTVSDDMTVTVYSNVAPPFVEITAPIDAGAVTAPTSVIGTAQSGLLASYVLQVRLKDEQTTNWITLATGNSSVVNGPLGVLDPTLQLNGIYEMRLVATDLAGRTAETDPVTVVIDRNMKVGNFSISFEDLNVPVAGIPIQVIRTYDSRDKRVGDFGAGWTMGIRNIRLQKNRNLGNKWVTQSTPGYGNFPIYSIGPGQDRLVTITMPNNETMRFKAVFAPTTQFGVPVEAGQLTFVAMSNTFGSLEISGDNTPIVVGSQPGTVDLFDENTVTIFDPTKFKLTTQEGDVYVIDQFTGLESLTDRNGNTLTVSSGGIFSSSGQNILFTRDGQDRITGITDPEGHVLTYNYNSNGDLTVFSDRVTNSTSFTYTNSHLVLDIVDPRGVRAVRNEYDENNRLISQTDASNNVLQFTHDIENYREVIEDRLGNITTHEYDYDGNVVRTIDALTNETTYTYDANDNETGKRDALGNVWSNTYDGSDNKLTETDPLGNTTRYSYNDRRDVTSIKDARGNVTTNTFDNFGNLVQEQDAQGHITTYAYDGQGNLKTRTDALGNVSSNAYDSAGRMTNMTVRDASGALLSQSAYTYSANGNQLTETRLRTSVSGAVFQVTSNLYDDQNRITQVTHPDGTITRMVYNAIGKVATNYDALGRATSYAYDDRGNQVSMTHPDGTTEQTAYDAENRKVAMTDRGGRITAMDYDALGRQTHTIFADATSNASIYDAIGRVIAQVDARGNETDFEYDPNCGCSGRKSMVIDALTNITDYAYDENANQVSMLDANGHTVSNVYDSLNRITTVRFHNGTTRQTTYDALSRRIAETDQSGVTTKYGYDGLGRLAAVTDALNQVTSYAYDEAGNLTAQTDANGHTTTFEYDNMGRRVKRTLPGAQVETYQYDLVGNMTNKVDFNGRSIAYTYDNMNRLISKLPLDGSHPGIYMAYNVIGLRTNMTDASGINSYVYDSRDRLVSKTTPQGNLNYSYDSQGNLASLQSQASHTSLLTYAYDPLNRLKSVIDQDTGMTLYDYDKVGNLQDYIYPNGVSHSYEYDTLNRLTNMGANLFLSNIASYAYALNASGHRTNVVENGGRHVSYKYDNLYRLTQETVAGSLVAGSIAYQYDPVGNRTNRNSSLGNILTKVYGYDQNDRLDSDTYDPNGNTIAATLDPPTFTNSTAFTYGYDFENRIIAATSAAEVVTIVYDGDGNRVRKTTTPSVGSPVATTFLVDDRSPSGYFQVLQELTTTFAATTSVSYAYGLDLISQTRSSILNAQSTTYYGYDGHGSVRFLTDESGQITDRFDYDAFGTLIDKTGSTANSYLYCGEQFDAELGMYFLRARYLDTDRGRFLSMDEYGGSRGMPLSLNKYLYANGNGASFVDPSGRMTLMEITGVSFLIGLNAIIYAHDLRLVGGNKSATRLEGFARVTLAFGVMAAAYEAALAGAEGQAFGLAAMASDEMSAGFTQMRTGNSTPTLLAQFVEAYPEVLVGLAPIASEISLFYGNGVRSVAAGESLENEVVAGVSSRDLLLPGGRPIGAPGTSASFREVTGNYADAELLYKKLVNAEGGGTPNLGYPGTGVDTGNGGFLGVRVLSTKSGPNTVATVDVNVPSVPEIAKIKFNQPNPP